VCGRTQNTDSRVRDGLHRCLGYEANAQHVLRERAGVVRPLGVGVLQGNGARLRLRREVDAQRVPRWGASAVDSLDSRRGATSCLAMPAPPPPSSAGKVTGQTRMLLFRHEGKTSSISPPAGGLTATIVVVVRRRKEYQVVAAVEGHELQAPKTKHCPGLKRLLETTHLELDGKLFVNTQQAPTWRANYRRFDPGGSLDRRVNCRRVSQPRWVGARRSMKGGEKRQRGNPRPSCFPAPRSGALAVGGYMRPRGRERDCPAARSPAQPTFSYESPGPSFYRRKERAQVYNGGCSSVLTCLAERS
jgi:hypothetical protein